MTVTYNSLHIFLVTFLYFVDPRAKW